MTGVKQDAVTTLVENDIKKHMNTTEQTILDNGVSKAVIAILDKTNDGGVKFTIQTSATAGVQQDEAAIKKMVAGKKKGDIQSALLARPGVKDVTVDYSPFWVYRTPTSTSKITVKFQQQ
jgi:hypothetical protein